MNNTTEDIELEDDNALGVNWRSEPPLQVLSGRMFTHAQLMDALNEVTWYLKDRLPQGTTSHDVFGALRNEGLLNIDGDSYALDLSAGYHVRPIAKGVYGEPSKIREELEELEDALEQGNRIMALVELSDLYGALKAVAENLGATMSEVRIMAEKTSEVFRKGGRR